MRTKWWDTAVTSFTELAILPEEDRTRIPDMPVDTKVLPSYSNDKLLLVGHYWFTGEPKPLTSNIACLDYSIASKGAGKLYAYRWSGERQLLKDCFIHVSKE